MKRIICLFLVLFCVSSMFLSAAAATLEDEIQPRWSYLNSVAADLDINWLGVATCTGSAVARDSVTIELCIYLQQRTQSGWETLRTWTSTGEVSSGVQGQYAVYKGFTYRVIVSAVVYDIQGNILETGSASDLFIY